MLKWASDKLYIKPYMYKKYFFKMQFITSTGSVFLTVVPKRGVQVQLHIRDVRH